MSRKQKELGHIRPIMLLTVVFGCFTPAKPDTQGRFFSDLLNDGNGIAIHRFQMVVMTITLGLLFLVSVATRLTMPEFDASLLTIMGISAGTYVALKLPQNPAPGAEK